MCLRKMKLMSLCIKSMLRYHKKFHQTAASYLFKIANSHVAVFSNSGAHDGWVQIVRAC